MLCDVESYSYSKVTFGITIFAIGMLASNATDFPWSQDEAYGFAQAGSTYDTNK